MSGIRAQQNHTLDRTLVTLMLQFDMLAAGHPHLSSQLLVVKVKGIIVSLNIFVARWIGLNRAFAVGWYVGQEAAVLPDLRRSWHLSYINHNTRMRVCLQKATNFIETNDVCFDKAH